MQERFHAKKGNTLLITIIVVAVIIGAFIFFNNNQAPNVSDSSATPPPIIEQVSNASTSPIDAVTPSPISDASSAPDTTQASPPQVSSKPAVKTFTIVGKKFSFSPSTIKVNKGDKVKIIFDNQDGFHNWVLDEFSAKTKTIRSGQKDEIEFIADKIGLFEFYCSVGEHRQLGMKGTLIVAQ